MICFTQLIVSFLYTVIFKEYQKSSTSFGLLHIKITLSICLLNSFFQFKSSNLVVLGLFSTKICWPCSNLLHSFNSFYYRHYMLKNSTLAFPFTYSCLRSIVKFSSGIPVATATDLSNSIVGRSLLALINAYSFRSVRSQS